jgi:hypothetical protein
MAGEFAMIRAPPFQRAIAREGKKQMRVLTQVRRWWFAAAAALAVATPLLAFNGQVASALSINAQSVVATVAVSPNPVVGGGTVSVTLSGFAAAGEVVVCTSTVASGTAGATVVDVRSFTVPAGGSATFTNIPVPSLPSGLTSLTVTDTCVGQTSGTTAVTIISVVAATTPPAIPEADVLILFGTGLTGLGGYAAVRLRALRRGLRP